MLICATELRHADRAQKPLIVISYAPADEPEHPAEGEAKWLSFVTGYLKRAIRHGAIDLWLNRLMLGGATGSRKSSRGCATATSSSCSCRPTRCHPTMSSTRKSRSSASGRRRGRTCILSAAADAYAEYRPRPHAGEKPAAARREALFRPFAPRPRSAYVGDGGRDCANRGRDLGPQTRAMAIAASGATGAAVVCAAAFAAPAG